MQYRQFGRLDWKVSALGFGCMRLPVLGGDNGAIDEPLATAMLRNAIDAGVNYIDTAWGYHHEQSEPFVGRALGSGYREKVALATKLPVWLVHSRADMDRLLDTQLERLQTDHIDFYLMHSLDQTRWRSLKALHLDDWLDARRAEGKIRQVGFSFHDQYPVFEEILDGFDGWDFCQIQYNYMDIDYQAGQRGLKNAAQRGLGVVVMEPLRGGSLARAELPSGVAEAFQSSTRDWSPVEWALQWLWDQPEVSLVLSGMSAPWQVEDNLRSASRSAVGCLSPADKELMEAVSAAWKGLAPVPCTHCEYCLPCPNGVEIPTVFSIYNDAVIYDRQAQGRANYRVKLEAQNQADACVECGQCETLCPQHIEIIEKLKDAHAYLSE